MRPVAIGQELPTSAMYGDKADLSWEGPAISSAIAEHSIYVLLGNDYSCLSGLTPRVQ